MPGRSPRLMFTLVNRGVRQNFEAWSMTWTARLSERWPSSDAITRPMAKPPDIMTDICARAGTHLREVLGKANDLVSPVPGTGQFCAAPEAAGLASLSANNSDRCGAFKGRVKIKAAKF